MLEELARLRENDGARREVLDRASFSMLHRPALGGQLIARICATEETAPELELLSELLGSGLDAARIARENRKKRGSAFLQTVADAVAMASGQDRLSPFHRLLLASAWTRNGLSAPPALELSSTDMEAAGIAPGKPVRADADAVLDDLFRNLIAQTEGDALALHAALTETFPAMPAEMRANSCVEQAESPADFIAAMSGRSTMAARDWAAGFSHACGHFRSSWPARSTTQDDRAMMHLISDAMSTGFTAAEVKTLGQWIAARHDHNCRT